MFEAIVQGLIQGLTEFLPVSSSGHLVLAQNLFGFRELDPAFNVFVQGGTIISLLVYYFPRLRSLKLDRRYIGLLVIASVPAVVVGLLLEDYIDSLFGSMRGMAFGFLLTTIFVWSSKWATGAKGEIRTTQAGLIGLAQAAAILPSLSRSGATIGTALMLGIKPEAAFDFSFLMSIPVLFGATVLSARHITWSPEMTTSYIVGFAVAAVSGYITLVLLSRILKKGKFYVFAPYTLALAIVSYFLS